MLQNLKVEDGRHPLNPYFVLPLVCMCIFFVTKLRLNNRLVNQSNQETELILIAKRHFQQYKREKYFPCLVDGEIFHCSTYIKGDVDDSINSWSFNIKTPVGTVDR